jgi:hypothetical protein
LDILCSLIGVLILIIVVLCVSQTQQTEGRTPEDVQMAQDAKRMRQEIVERKAQDVILKEKLASLEELQKKIEEKEQRFIKLRKLINTSKDLQEANLKISQRMQKELDDLITEITGLKLQMVESTKEIALFTQKYKGICKNCGKQGHKADVCRSKTNTSGTNANGTNEKNEIKCYNCNKYVGHIARDCPEPKRPPRGEKKKETGMYVGMCEEINGMEATDDIPGPMDVTQKATETPTEELLRVCFVPTMEDEWYEDQYCASSNRTERQQRLGHCW